MHRHTVSFINAFRGIWIAITTQPNLRIHFVVASLVFVASVYLRCTMLEILIFILTVMIVMVTEMVNTALEFLSDAVTLEHNKFIKKAKDVSAGAVLIAAIFSILIGIIIFLPKIIA